MRIAESIRVQRQIYGSLLDMRILRHYLNWLVYRLSVRRFRHRASKLVVLTNLFFSGNARALMEFAVAKRDDRFFWASRDFRTLDALRSSGMRAVMINSREALKVFEETGVWVASHLGFPNFPPWLPKFYTSILLWHGAGPKPGSSREMYEQADYVVLPSEEVKKRHVELLGAPEEKCLVTGYPRIDRLLRLAREGGGDLGFPPGPTVLLAPTFDFWPRYWPPIGELVRWAAERRINVILRTHPYTRFRMDLNHVGKLERKFENFRFMDMFVEPDTELLLAKSDVLVTDWSSIFTDYLALDRPVVFLRTPTPERERRTISDVDLSEWPGPVVGAEELPRTIHHALDDPREYSVVRRKVFEMVHGRPDGRASERLYKFILSLIR